MHLRVEDLVLVWKSNQALLLRLSLIIMDEKNLLPR